MENKALVLMVTAAMSAAVFGGSKNLIKNGDFETLQFLHDGSEVRVREPAKRSAQNGDGDTSAYFELPIFKPDVEIPVIEVLLK